MFSVCSVSVNIFSPPYPKQEAIKLQHDMRKKKQEMLKTQFECQKVKPAVAVSLFCTLNFSCLLQFLVLLGLLFLSGFDKPAGEEPRDETRGEGQHHEDPEGTDGEDRTAAERNEPQPQLAGVHFQSQPQPAQDQD